jgi:hypothetical protein
MGMPHQGNMPQSNNQVSTIFFCLKNVTYCYI